MVRRYRWDAERGALVEIRAPRRAPDPMTRYQTALSEYRTAPESNDHALRAAALERAERREYAVRRYGTESRWTET